MYIGDQLFGVMIAISVFIAYMSIRNQIKELNEIGEKNGCKNNNGNTKQ